MKKFTTIRTKKGHFNIFDDGGEKYFLKYVEKGALRSRVVGYLVKENGTGYNGDYFLQEAFFDKLNWPYTSFRSVLSDYDTDMNKDLWDVLIAACYQVEEAFWCKNTKQRDLIDKDERWSQLINKLQKGADLEKAVRSLQQRRKGKVLALNRV